jgi:hypothetical protein
MDVSEFNKLSLKDLRKVTGRLVSAGNKRIRRAEEKGVDSPAFAYIRESGGMLSTKGKDLQQLRHEFVRAKNFMEAETSTIKGAENFKAESIELLKQEGVNLSNESFDTVMKAVETLKRNDDRVAMRSMKYRMMAEAEVLVQKGYTQEAIENKLFKQVDKIYKKVMKKSRKKSPSSFMMRGE